MAIRPAPADHGIWFRRTDLEVSAGLVPARWDAVVPARLCTRIANAQGTEVSTVEHLMAALAGCGVHNALVEIDGPEVPVLDGSSAPFVRAILGAGLRRLAAPLRVLRVRAPVRVEEGEAWARLEPAELPEIVVSIDFPDAAIGRQQKALELSNGRFVHELADARTFCRLADVEAMRGAGLAMGGTVLNAVVVDGARVLTPGGLRHADEPVRHKMLDALGDLSLAGAPLIGRYVGHRPGHGLTNRLLRRLFETPGALQTIVCPPDLAARLPGAGVAAGDLAAIA
jgi:UDP-3-O-[3-hydroxymyristoyl] N-acetylglucosamine deacetylase